MMEEKAIALLDETKKALIASSDLQSLNEKLEKALTDIVESVKKVAQILVEALQPIVDEYIRKFNILYDDFLRLAAENPRQFYLYKHGKRRVRKKWRRILQKRLLKMMSQEDDKNE